MDLVQALAARRSGLVLPMLALPLGSARLTAQPAPVQGRLSHRIQSTLGRGGAPVRVVTTNGPLTIRRAR